MDHINELADSSQLLKNGQLIPKIEPIDVEFIKKEEIEDTIFVEEGIVESLNVNKDSIKEEILEIEGRKTSSSLLV